MSSGLEFSEDMADPLADVSRMILRKHDMAAFASNKSLEVEPGTRWQYSSGTTNPTFCAGSAREEVLSVMLKTKRQTKVLRDV